MTARGDALPRPLSIDDLHDLVRRAIAGEAPLDDLVTDALWGSRGAAPELWGDWPPAAREAWDTAVWLHRLTTNRQRRSKRAGQPPTLEATWDAIERVAPDPLRWWDVPLVTWEAIGEKLDLSWRAVYEYVVIRYRWEFQGRGHARRIIRAPCVACGTPTEPALIEDRRCPACR